MTESGPNKYPGDAEVAQELGIDHIELGEQLGKALATTQYGGRVSPFIRAVAQEAITEGLEDFNSRNISLARIKRFAYGEKKLTDDELAEFKVAINRDPRLKHRGSKSYQRLDTARPAHNPNLVAKPANNQKPLSPAELEERLKEIRRDPDVQRALSGQIRGRKTGAKKRRDTGTFFSSGAKPKAHNKSRSQGKKR